MAIITKVCAYCDKEFTYDCINGRNKKRSYCSDDCFKKGVRRKSFLTHIDARREHVRAWSYAKHYGKTIEDYDAILKKQGGVCAICGGLPFGRPHELYLQWDHHHESGKVRALLCKDCNQMIACAKENPNTLLKGVEYLKKHA
jgi:hypothetical protein